MPCRQRHLQQAAKDPSFKVLIKVVHKNPGINLTNVLACLPGDVNLNALEELVAPIVDRVSQVKRVEGQPRD
jgi:hypothetical protein